jgi:hypothetical protein
LRCRRLALAVPFPLPFPSLSSLFKTLALPFPAVSIYLPCPARATAREGKGVWGHWAAIEAQFNISNSTNKTLFTSIRQDVLFLGRKIGQLVLKPSFDTLYELLEKGTEEQIEKSAERILQYITADHRSEVKQHLNVEKADILSSFKSEGSTKASNEDLNRLQGLMANMSKTSKQSRDEVSSLHLTTIKESKTNLD